MYRPTDLAKLVTQICEERDLSAAAASRAAGLSVNQVRNIQRGLHRPGAHVITALSEALRVDSRTTAELRRLAGIDPDPAATPEARAARRDAWPLLTYTLVNHIMLPERTLTREIARRAGRDAAALRAAAQAPDLRRFYASDAAKGGRPRGLVALLERNFGQLTPDTVAPLHRCALAESRLTKADTPHPPGRHWLALVSPLWLLVELRAPDVPRHGVADILMAGTLHGLLAAALFPPILHEACLVWPFEKLYLPYARHGQAVQRRLHDQVRAGMSLVELDRTLLNPADLVADTPAIRPAGRPFSFYDSEVMPAQSATLVPLPRELDSLFDHLDRLVFLDRFPLLKLDPGRFTRALPTNLPSWALCKQRLLEAGIAERDARVSAIQCPVTPRPDPLCRSEDYLHRAIAEAFQERVEARAEAGSWRPVLQAGETLGLRPDIVELLRAICSRAERDESAASGSL